MQCPMNLDACQLFLKIPYRVRRSALPAWKPKILDELDGKHVSSSTHRHQHTAGDLRLLASCLGYNLQLQSN